MSAATGWQNSDECAAGDNSTTLNKTGFSAVPAGNYFGDYNYFGSYAIFWSATQYIKSHSAYYRGVYYDDASVYGSYRVKYFGYSVRCLRD